MEVFIDESGDLGFGENATHTFVVGYVFSEQPEAIRKAIKRLIKRINQRSKNKISEFKFSNDSRAVREKAFNKIKKLEFNVGFVVIDKHYVKQELRDNRQLLYNYLVVNYVITALTSKFDLDKLTLIIDKSLPQQSQKAFNEYAENKLDSRLTEKNINHTVSLAVKHVDSRNDPGIQLADYCSGAAFAKFERGDATYYDLIRDKIRFKNSWGNIEW